MRHSALAVLIFGVAQTASADCPWKGTWQQRTPARPNPLTLVIEASGDGCKLTYTIKPKDMPQTIVATIDQKLDGTEAPMMADGKPTSQTLSVKQVDARHWTSIIKYGGKQTATGKIEIAADGKAFTQELTITADSPAGAVGKRVEVFDKK